LSPAGGSDTIRPDTALGGCIIGSFPVALDGLQEKGFFVFTCQKFLHCPVLGRVTGGHCLELFQPILFPRFQRLILWLDAHGLIFRCGFSQLFQARCYV